MPPVAEPLPVPLAFDESGTIRVGGLRLTLDTVVERPQAGDSANEIQQSFPPVELADIYAVVSY